MGYSVLLRRVAFLMIGGPLLALTMGQGCPVVVPGPVVVVPRPGPIVVDRPVTVILVNDSGAVIDPVLYAHPGTVYVPEAIMSPVNLVDIGPPLALDEVVTVTLTCGEAGSLLADADVVQFADGTMSASTLLREGEHYFCGESVTFYYDPLPAPPLPVTVEVVNATSNAVDAFFWSDPLTFYNPDDVAIPANLVDLGPPLLPGEVVTVTLDCADAGTFLVDGDLLLEPTGAMPSANLLLLNEGEHFLCGDLVSFYYEVDGLGGFFISADVNDINIAP